jgi:hypothetical protein
VDAFVLARLERFGALATVRRVRGIPVLRRLADHALDVALADCAALGLVDEAMAVLIAALGDRPRPS